MRLLLIAADTFPPFRVDVSVLFGESLPKRGHRIDYLLQSEAPCETPYRTDWQGADAYVGANGQGTTRLGRIKKHLQGLANDLRVFSLARRQRYDVIQVKDKFVSVLPALLAAKLNGSKFTYWLSYPFPESSLHEAAEGTARYPLLYRIRGHFFAFVLYRVIARFADHVFVQSQQMLEDVAAVSALTERDMTPVPMGFSPSDFARIDAPPTRLDNAVVYIGTLLQTRHLDFLVRVLAAVRERIPNAQLYLVGPEELPGDMDVLRKEAERLGVAEHLHLPGPKPRPDALAYAKHAAVCVSPFYPTPILNSTSPTKLVEYMALGKAVVANDHPEQRRVIEDSQGGLCTAYEVADFAQAVCRLMEDPALAERMGRAGYQYVHRERTYERIAELTEAAYARLLQAP